MCVYVLWPAWLGMAASLHLFSFSTLLPTVIFIISFFLSFLSTISQLASSVCLRACYQPLSWSWFPSDFKSGTWVSPSEWYVGFFFPYVIFFSFDFSLPSLLGRRLSARWTHGILFKTHYCRIRGSMVLSHRSCLWICNAFISLSFKMISIYMNSIGYAFLHCMLLYFLKECLSWLLHLTVTEILTWKWKSDQLMNESSQ